MIFPGNTPLVYLANFSRITQNHIFAKLEHANPTGSVKERPAFYMIENALKRGEITTHTTVIEATSGNTGIALAAVCARRRLSLKIFMPENMTIERRTVISRYGAEIILTPAGDGMKGAISEAQKEAEYPSFFYTRQFENMDNPLSHYLGTGPEILSECPGIDYLICGIGTGGTVSGTGRFLKERKRNITIIGVEPEESAVLSGKSPDKHGIQGIGAGFIPKILDRSVIDYVQTVSTESAYDHSALASSQEGISAGLSSGAVLGSAIDYINNHQIKGKRFVLIFPDSSDRYLSLLKNL